MDKSTSVFRNSKALWIIGGLLLSALIIETGFIGLYLSSANKKDVLGTSTQSSHQSAPQFIDCFVNGMSIKATMETCTELSKQSEPTPIPSSAIAPINQAQVIKSAPVTSPERKKVSVMIDDYGGLTKGTYYCYDDKVNQLANLQNQIRMKNISAQGCESLSKTEGTACSNTNCKLNSSSDEDVKAFDACSLKCYSDASAKCDNGVGDLRRELVSEVQQYCP
jgi:hypothetical protein